MRGSPPSSSSLYSTRRTDSYVLGKNPGIVKNLLRLEVTSPPIFLIGLLLLKSRAESRAKSRAESRAENRAKKEAEKVTETIYPFDVKLEIDDDDIDN